MSFIVFRHDLRNENVAIIERFGNLVKFSSSLPSQEGGCCKEGRARERESEESEGECWSVGALVAQPSSTHPSAVVLNTRELSFFYSTSRLVLFNNKRPMLQCLTYKNYVIFVALRRVVCVKLMNYVRVRNKRKVKEGRINRKLGLVWEAKQERNEIRCKERE